MKAKLGAGWALTIQPRRRWFPRPSRRVWALVAVVALGCICWGIVSEIRARTRLGPLRTALAALSEQGSARWANSDPRAEPVTRLLISLTWWQSWRLGHNRDSKLEYSALLPFQQSLFHEACELERARTEADRPAGSPRQRTIPLYLRLAWPPYSGRRDIVFIEVAYTTAEFHGFRGGSALELDLGKGGA